MGAACCPETTPEGSLEVVDKLVPSLLHGGEAGLRNDWADAGYKASANDDTAAVELQKLREENAHLRARLAGVSEVEAVQLNALVGLMWPKVSDFVMEQALNMLEGSIDDRLPPFLMGKVAFRRETCRLGTSHPQIQCLTVAGSTQHSVKGRDQVVTVSMHIHWEGECSLDLDVAGVGMGVHNTGIDGVLFVDLVGLSPVPPFFQGVRYYFIHPPRISFQWHGAVSVLNRRFIHHTMVDVMLDILCSCAVVPNRMGFVLSPGADIFRVQYPRPEGILRLVVKEAKALLPQDVSLIGSLRASVHAAAPMLVSSSSDPYFKLRCGAEVLTSEVQKRNLNPTFNYVAHLLVSRAATQHVTLTFFDKDFASPGDYLGMCDLPVSRLISWGGDDRVVELEDEKGATGGNGRVRLSAEWRPIVVEPILRGIAGEERLLDPCFLFVGVYEASGVPRPTTPGLKVHYWPVAECTHLVPRARPESQNGVKVSAHSHYGVDAEGGGMGRTDSAASASPTRSVPGDPDDTPPTGPLDLHLDAAMSFLVEDSKAAKLTLHLKRRPRVRKAKEEDLGTYVVSVADLLRAPRYSMYSVVALGASGISLKVRLKLSFLGEPSTQLPE